MAATRAQRHAIAATRRAIGHPITPRRDEKRRGTTRRLAPRPRPRAARRPHACVPSQVPGDFGWDPMDMYPTDPAGRVEMQTKELNNGRVAMIAIAGMVAQELATGAKLF